MSIKPNHAAPCALFVIITLIIAITPATSAVHATKALPRTFTSQELPPPSGYPLQYNSFAGATYNLTAYDGLYCRYALPASWTQPGALTISQLRKLIDLTDLAYAQLAEITAGEPQGPGLLTIAVIPTGNMAGHAGSSFKGVELSDNELGSVMQNLCNLKRFLAATRSNSLPRVFKNPPLSHTHVLGYSASLEAYIAGSAKRKPCLAESSKSGNRMKYNQLENVSADSTDLGVMNPREVLAPSLSSA